MINEVASLGGDVDRFVPSLVAQVLKEKYNV
jgi:phosphopantetheine adenylyltransferase